MAVTWGQVKKMSHTDVLAKYDNSCYDARYFRSSAKE